MRLPVTNFAKLQYEVKNKLLEDAELRSLVYSSPGQEVAASKAVMQDRFVIKPVVDAAQFALNGDKNCIVSIVLAYINTQEETMVGLLNVTILNAISEWNSETDKTVKVISIAEKIIELLHREKFSTAGLLELSDITLVEFDEITMGYNLSFTVIDERADSSQDEFSSFR